MVVPVAELQSGRPEGDLPHAPGLVRDHKVGRVVGACVPDRREIAFVEPTSSNFEGYRIAIANADGHDGGRRTLVEAGDLIWWPAISPDGSRIVYRVGDYSLHVVDVSTGASSEVADGENADWVDDDTLIVNPT